LDQGIAVSAPAYDVRDLEYTVGRNRIISEISVSVQAGHVLLVAGPSGSGKSTFLKLLVRLLDPTGGSVRFFGKELEQISPPQLRRMAVYVPQAPALGPVPVEENLRLGPAFLRREIDHDRITHILRTVKLPPEYASRNTRSLSGGEQYRLSLAMALAMEPDVLLLDEPTASLDPELADHVGSLISQLTEGSVCVVLVTHDIRLAKGLTGSYLFLEKGSTQASGDLSDLDEDGDTRAIWRRLSAMNAEK
jgi:putative ABC transport system ATP-binding protein